ncbi:cation:dicarboxylate symporter family transporter [Bradyrhizobium sp. WSM3983]|uniref:cation:dicarboxylate symporter family transporter n=1 Tax=Bradyrhizobium sp. WSM3983 TaxID=1038867 RepID=UPI000483DB7E|nr:cation:dicarboxylase symporter family transporter [Bradyrhizobium sp. WSM3983]
MSTTATTDGERTRSDSDREHSLWTNLGFQVAVSMVLGIAVGLIWPEFASSLKILGDIFLRLIKTAVAPLVFLTVAVGVMAAGDIRRVGKVGLIAIIYFEIVSTLALALGVLFGHLSGVGLNLGHITASVDATKGAAAAAKAAEASHTTFTEFLLNIFPDNFFGAFARGELLQVLVIALIFGFGLMAITPSKRVPIENGLNSISTTFFEFIHVIMRLAPIGTFGAIAYAVGSNGTAVLLSLIYFVMAFYVLVGMFIVVVLGSICALFRFNLFDLLRYVRDEIMIMLGTASSESVLPRLLEKLPAYGASRQTVGLVLPTGYAFNLDGTSLFMSISFIFLANAYGVSLTWQQELGSLAVMLLTSKGAATVSGGSFVVFAATVTTTGILPIEGLALIFGVYRFLSIALSTCNVIGNAVATVVVAKLAGEFENEALSRQPGARV